MARVGPQRHRKTIYIFVCVCVKTDVFVSIGVNLGEGEGETNDPQIFFYVRIFLGAY